MAPRAIDLAVALVLFVGGIIMLAGGYGEMGSMSVTAGIGFLSGLYRDRPGGIDEAVRGGSVDFRYIEDEEGNDGEVA